MKIGWKKKKRPSTWPLTQNAVTVWFVLIVGLGVSTGLGLGLYYDWPSWAAVTLCGGFTAIYSRIFWEVLKFIQRKRTA